MANLMAKLVSGNASPKRPNLVAIAATVVSRSELAGAAVKLWKNDPGIRKEFSDAGALYNCMNEYCRLPAEEKGDGKMNDAATKKDGAELGLALHKRWTEDPALREKHGSFKVFVESERKAEDEGIRERTKAAGGGR